MNVSLEIINSNHHLIASHHLHHVVCALSLTERVLTLTHIVVCEVSLALEYCVVCFGFDGTNSIGIIGYFFDQLSQSYRFHLLQFLFNFAAKILVIVKVEDVVEIFVFIYHPFDVNVRGTILDKCSNGKNKSITLKARL